MKNILCSLLASTVWLLLATACAGTEHETATSTRDPRAGYTPPSGRGQRLSGATVLNTVRTTHTFSNEKTPDVFILQLRGPRVLTGQLHLIVLSSRGDTLRHEVLPARLLQDAKALTVRDKEISVLRGMNNFFSPSRFVQPAISSGTRQPAEVSTEAWNSVRADSKAVGFDYPAADGSEHRLAYSAQLGRAVVLTE